MVKGTASKGLRGKRNLHLLCKRCGNSSFHRRKKTCSKCKYSL